MAFILSPTNGLNRRKKTFNLSQMGVLGGSGSLSFKMHPPTVQGIVVQLRTFAFKFRYVK
jgi:hypothetical protein